MTTISASLVKELRDQTGAGMMDVKRALVETDGDLEAARVLLRERGMATAAKRADRTTSEGEVLVTVSGSTGAMVAVGCETEPVSKNEEFLAFAEKALEAVEAGGEGAVDGARRGAAGARRQARGEHRRRRRRTPGGRGGRVARRVRPPAREQDRRARARPRREPGCRATARDAHLVRGPALPDARETCPRRTSRRSARSTRTPTRCSRSPRTCARRSSTGCCRSGSSPRTCSPSRPGSTTRARRWSEALADDGLELLDFRRFSVAG